MQFADVIVDISLDKLDKSFQYKVPERLEGQLTPGMCVMIPFGTGNRQVKGYCIGLGDEAKVAPEKLKEISGIAMREAGGEDVSIALAAWIRENYGSTMIQALKTVLPMRKSVQKLLHRTIERTASIEELLSMLGESKRKSKVAKARLLEELLSEERIPYEWVTGKLNVSAQTITSLERAGALRIVSAESFRNPVKFGEEKRDDKSLSTEQAKILDDIFAEYDQGVQKTYLLHGITGSGKTEVYVRLADGVVSRGRQVIVLIPEIALTYQTLLRFYRHFGDRVSVMNSTLSAGEKYDQCQRAKNGEIDVIIGPRSALFTPFPNLGLIIMDEEHEASYKSESSPKYHARETAEKLAELT
ncbi:MAG: DEAD/DEAH box helicase family protein, partial [Lachnospiraceae bacterium]|nr:DEAD/DEAH box helicase family protein [Lachnospiraceae bacterium]